MYLPADGLFTRELVQRIHVETLHGGLTLTMAAIREEYWTPKLRKLVKSVRSACCCWGCKSFQASPLTVQRPEPLPTDRTIGGAEFKVIGTAFVGSLKYKQHKKSKGKAYRAIFSCSLSRAVQQELMSSMETSHFITSFKCLIASPRTMEAPALRQETGYVNCENTNVSKVFWMDTTALGSLT